MPLGVLASIWIEDEETVSLYDSSLGRAVLSRLATNHIGRTGSGRDLQ